MSETADHAARLLRAYQAQEERFVERRFPLQFAPEVPALRELYSQAKGFHSAAYLGGRWNEHARTRGFDVRRHRRPSLEAIRIRTRRVREGYRHDRRLGDASRAIRARGAVSDS